VLCIVKIFVAVELAKKGTVFGVLDVGAPAAQLDSSQVADLRLVPLFRDQKGRFPEEKLEVLVVRIADIIDYPLAIRLESYASDAMRRDF
jgi:hypothetical protein